MAFLTRYPIQEITGLGEALFTATEEHLDPGHPLRRVSEELRLLSRSLAQLVSKETQALEQADFLRDQLVLALYHGLKSWTHRADRQEDRTLAQELLETLLPDGYAWIDAPYEHESDRMGLLLGELRRHKEPLLQLQLSPLVDALAAAEGHFVELFTHLSTAEEERVTTKTKILVNSFHRKLDLYVALVRERYNPTAHRDLLTPLLAPLREATARMKANR